MNIFKKLAKGFLATFILVGVMAGVAMAARNFDGSNDYLDAGNPSELNLTGDTVTLSAWIRLEILNGEGKILAKWSDAGGDFQYLLSSDSSDKPLFAIYNGATQIALGSTTLSTDNWHHIAGVYDGSEVRVYLNGAEDGSKLTSGNMPSTSAPVRIGAGSGGSGTEDPFDGDVGHVAIWDTPLSENHIKSLASGINPRQIQADDLVEYWAVNGQSAETGVVNGNDATVVNGTTVAEEPPIPNSIVAP